MIHSVGMAALACLAAVFASFMLMDMLRSRPDWAAAWGVFFSAPVSTLSIVELITREGRE